MAGTRNCALLFSALLLVASVILLATAVMSDRWFLIEAERQVLPFWASSTTIANASLHATEVVVLNNGPTHYCVNGNCRVKTAADYASESTCGRAAAALRTYSEAVVVFTAIACFVVAAAAVQCLRLLMFEITALERQRAADANLNDSVFPYGAGVVQEHGVSSTEPASMLSASVQRQLRNNLAGPNASLSQDMRVMSVSPEAARAVSPARRISGTNNMNNISMFSAMSEPHMVMDDRTRASMQFEIQSDGEDPKRRPLAAARPPPMLPLPVVAAALLVVVLVVVLYAVLQQSHLNCGTAVCALVRRRAEQTACGTACLARCGFDFSFVFLCSATGTLFLAVVLLVVVHTAA
jgi:hypothetical protein